MVLQTTGHVVNVSQEAQVTSRRGQIRIPPCFGHPPWRDALRRVRGSWVRRAPGLEIENGTQEASWYP